MLKLNPIPEPIEFTNSRAIRNTKTTVEQTFLNIEENVSLTAKEVTPKFPEKPHWTDYKDALADGQHDRCAYCELDVIGTSYGDVEHYRPKGRIRKLNPDRMAQGTEKKSKLSNVEGRDFQTGCNTGYWWLAYEWNNYLLSCGICNQPWKSDLFPVVGDTNTTIRPVPGCEGEEDPLLINPFIENPTKHIYFKDDGTVRAITERGLATIETLGLWRGSLRRKRQQHLLTIKSNIDCVMRNKDLDEPNGEAILGAAKTILDLGAYGAVIFPGVVRNYFERKAKMKWESLQLLFDALNAEFDFLYS